jgi:hypothetical protein
VHNNQPNWTTKCGKIQIAMSAKKGKAKRKSRAVSQDDAPCAPAAFKFRKMTPAEVEGFQEYPAYQVLYDNQLVANRWSQMLGSNMAQMQQSIAAIVLRLGNQNVPPSTGSPGASPQHIWSKYKAAWLKALREQYARTLASNGLEALVKPEPKVWLTHLIRTGKIFQCDNGTCSRICAPS